MCLCVVAERAPASPLDQSLSVLEELESRPTACLRSFQFTKPDGGLKITLERGVERYWTKEREYSWQQREGRFKNLKPERGCFLACVYYCLLVRVVFLLQTGLTLFLYTGCLYVIHVCRVHSSRNRTACGFAGIVESPQSLLCCWEYKYQYVPEEASTESVHSRCLGKLLPENHSISIWGHVVRLDIGKWIDTFSFNLSLPSFHSSAPIVICQKMETSQKKKNKSIKPEDKNTQNGKPPNLCKQNPLRWHLNHLFNVIACILSRCLMFSPEAGYHKNKWASVSCCVRLMCMCRHWYWR